MNNTIVKGLNDGNLKEISKNIPCLYFEDENDCDIFWKLVSFSKDEIMNSRKKNDKKRFITSTKINNTRYRCIFTTNTSKFVFKRKSYRCTFDKDFNYLEINGWIFHKLRYKGIFNIWFDIDNRINSILGKTPFYLNGRPKKFKYDNFHTHVANVFYMKSFNNIEDPTSIEPSKLPISIENKHFTQIKNNNEDKIIMDSLLFYKNERVYCIFEKGKNINNKYKLVQLATRKNVIWDLTDNAQNLTSNITLLPERTINNTTSIFINKKNKNSFSNINTFKNHIFVDHWKDRLKEIFKTYKKYNGIDKSIPLTADQIENLFKAGLINKIIKEVDNNVEKEAYISGDELYIYIDNKNTDTYYPYLKICFFLPIDFCGKKYYIVISYNNKGTLRSKTPRFEYETLYTEEYRNNQIMPYESIKNKISQ